MENEKKLRVGIVLLTIIILFLLLFSYLNDSVMQIELVKNDEVETKELDKFRNEIEEFLVIGKRFADNFDYVNGSNNCVNASNDFNELAKGMDFKTERITGCDNESCHRFIRVTFDYEPQTGRFVDYDDNFTKTRQVKDD